MKTLANISSFESLIKQNCAVHNAINLQKTHRGGGGNLAQASGGVNLSKDHLKPYFGMIADGIGNLLSAGVSPNSILRYCQQRISMSTSADMANAARVGKALGSGVASMIGQHARGFNQYV